MDELVLPEVVRRVLDQLDEGDQQACNENKNILNFDIHLLEFALKQKQKLNLWSDTNEKFLITRNLQLTYPKDEVDWRWVFQGGPE